MREVAGDRRGGGHRGRDQVRAAALALPALEVPVRGGGAPLARLQDVGVHPEAHRAARAPPVESGVDEDPVQPFPLGLQLHRDRAGHDQRAEPLGHGAPSTTPAASRRSSIREFVQEPMKTVSGRMSRILVPGSSAM